MSSFDPVNFMNASFDGSFSTEFMPVPEGEFRASIKEVTPGVTTTGKPYMRVQWIIDSEEARQATNMAEPKCSQTLWLDVTESGGLDMGKGRNVGLGRLRAAVDQNTGSWQPGMLIGKVATVKVKHSIDKRDGQTIQAEVSAVAHI